MTISNVEKTNPYDYIKPVANRDLFAGRIEELQIIREEIRKLKGDLWHSPIIALSGERRVGKTSILLRIEEMCEEEGLISARMTITNASIENPWDFWRDLFLAVDHSTRRKGLEAFQGSIPIGFQKADEYKDYKHYDLQFSELYKSMPFGSSIPLPILQDDLRIMCSAITEKGYFGLVIMLDEAHLLVDSNDIQEQLRQSIESERCGIVFAGEPSIGSLFTDQSRKFYEQARMIQIRNYQDIDDVASCAVKPLVDKERALMSPMTVDYLARLSQGKPNQIRLICSSIYSSFQRKEQEDLNINIKILQDVLEIIASTYTEYDLKKLVDKIQGLSNVDLEVLYRITRYPDWDIEQIIDLDESFRGESRSELAEERRRRILLEKRLKFIEQGILKDIENKCILAGDEFLYLYIRFLYEIRKYGDLSKRLELGKGVPTAFSEKVDKLVNSLCFDLRRHPRIRVFTHIGFSVEAKEIRRKLRRRFELLYALQSGKKLEIKDIEKEDFIEIMHEFLQVCELVRDSGAHHFVSILVRNAQNVNEFIHVELYFDPAPIITLVGSDTEDLLKKQADRTNVWVEDIDDFKIAYLPTLRDLFQILRGLTLEQIIEKLDEVANWRISSVQHIIQAGREAEGKENKKYQESESKEVKEQEEGEEWIKRYNSGDKRGAIDILDEKIASCTAIKDNPRLARYYNDRGYIKSTLAMGEIDEAENDLKKAIAYFHQHLELTLLNLAVIYIDKEDYPTSINYIEDALFLAVARENILAGYLKLRLPIHSTAPIGKIEQRPANVIEAGYINLAFALLSSDKPGQALEAIEEGLALLPNSYRLSHAKARILLFRKKASLADDIYLELNENKIDDDIIKREVRTYVEKFIRKKRRQARG